VFGFSSSFGRPIAINSACESTHEKELKKMSNLKVIKPLEAYDRASDADLTSRATAVLTGLTGNSHFVNPPVDLASLKANIDSFSFLVSESLDGSKKVIAEKNKQRIVLIKQLRLLGRYVDVTCNEDMALFKSSGFEPASNSRSAPRPLPTPLIRKVKHASVSGQLLVHVRSAGRAKAYDLRYAPVSISAPPANWTTEPMPDVKSAFAVNGLTPGTTYAFQVRARGPLGYTDWSDSVTFMCT
jgi:hypothetical protein